MSGRIPWAMNRAIIRRSCIVSRTGGGSATAHPEDAVWHARMLPIGEEGSEAKACFRIDSITCWKPDRIVYERWSQGSVD